jgi:hypothetical protein
LRVAGTQAEVLGDYGYHESTDKTEENESYTVGVTRALCADERLMLRARSFTLALASRNEGLVAAVERARVKVREVEALGADVARIFATARDMSECSDGR